jgi:hypothetical protein
LLIWLQPEFVKLFGKDFPVFGIFSSPALILACLVVLAGIAIISAAYPAWVATKVQAKDLLQKKGYTKAGDFDLREIAEHCPVCRLHCHFDIADGNYPTG